ncbi:hypothetical protein ACFL96_05905 [Thermoproteota archaeon]
MRKNILEEAYELLFPTARAKREFKVTYSGRFKDFGAHIYMEGSFLELKLSRKYYRISKEIQIGLAQELLCKLFKRKKNTMYIDIYNNFVKSLHLAIPKDKSHPVLEASFNRINYQYFLGLIERPNLVWGKMSKRTLGSYDYKTDTITVSRVFEKAEDRLLDYVMFHEALHKQRKFKISGSKTLYHDGKFKRAEKVFQDAAQTEKDMNKFVNRVKVRDFFGL